MVGMRLRNPAFSGYELDTIPLPEASADLPAASQLEWLERLRLVASNDRMWYASSCAHCDSAPDSELADIIDPERKGTRMDQYVKDEDDDEDGDRGLTSRRPRYV